MARASLGRQINEGPRIVDAGVRDIVCLVGRLGWSEIRERALVDLSAFRGWQNPQESMSS